MNLVLPDHWGELTQEIGKELMSPSPNVIALQKRCEKEWNLSEEDARKALYQIVCNLNGSLFSAITKLELILTEGCNLACTYCFEKNMLGYKRMPLPIAERAIDFLFDYSGDKRDVSVTLFGGEPMLNFQTVEQVVAYTESTAASRNKHIRFNMTSNGTLINTEKAEYLARHQIYVLLSIDGMAATNDKYRVDKEGRGTFDKVVAGLRELKKTQKWIGVKMTVMPTNVSNLFQDVMGLRAIGANQFLIGHATGIDWCDDSMRCYGEQLRQLLAWYKAEKDDSLRIEEFDEILGNDHSFFGCQAGRNSVSVSITGEISPCSKVLALDNQHLLSKLGDVFSGITHIQNRLDLVSCSKLRAACSKVGIEDKFQGGCFVTNYEENRDIFVPNLNEHKFSLIKRSSCSGCSHH